MIAKCTICGKRRPCERQHFPVPQSLGGTGALPLCVSCHDATDRMTLDGWDPIETWRGMGELWEKMNVDGRLLLMKMYLIVVRAASQVESADRPESTLMDRP